MSHDEVTSNTDPEQEDALAHAAIGAYILGALPDSERIAFEAHLRDCPDCQQELRELGPIAALLPRLYDDLDLPELEALPIGLEPSPDLKERIVAEASGAAVVEAVTESPALEAVDASVAAAVPDLDETIVTGFSEPEVQVPEAVAATASGDATVVAAASVAGATASQAKLKPRGRIAPGDAPPEAKVVSLPRERKSILPWAIAAAAAILATGAILWALAMMGQIDDLKGERNLQDQQIAQLSTERDQYLSDTAALVFPLVSTTSSQGGDAATGMVYMDPDPDGWGGVIAFRGMTQPPAGQVYQLWMIDDGQAPIPGPTFTPDADGKAMVQVGGDASDAGSMAITMEPDGGSQAPTTTPIMQGSLTA